jgi:hypothetical protein
MNSHGNKMCYSPNRQQQVLMTGMQMGQGHNSKNNSISNSDNSNHSNVHMNMHMQNNVSMMISSVGSDITNVTTSSISSSTDSASSSAEINTNVNNAVANVNGSESSFYSNYNIGRSTSNDKSRKGRHTTNGNLTAVTIRLISSQRSPLSIEKIEPYKSALNANNTANCNVNHPNRINYILESRKLFVNAALNGDLTCTYRNSKLSAISVDGNIQILLKADSTAFVPFTLKLSDVYDNIDSIVEHTKFASVVSKEEC